MRVVAVALLFSASPIIVNESLGEPPATPPALLARPTAIAESAFEVFATMSDTEGRVLYDRTKPLLSVHRLKEVVYDEHFKDYKIVLLSADAQKVATITEEHRGQTVVILAGDRPIMALQITRPITDGVIRMPLQPDAVERLKPLIDADAEPLQATIDAYLAQVAEVIGHAVGPKLLGNARQIESLEFSCRVDPPGNPSQVRASVAPPNRRLEQTIVQVIRTLKFPPIPRRILEEGGYKFLEFRNKMLPRRPERVGPNQAMRPTASPQCLTFRRPTHVHFAQRLLSSAVADLILVRPQLW
jgi:hypothetical protein